MTSYLDKLNLRPVEKRLLVGVVAMVFLVFNVLVVWPHFSDWDRAQRRLAKARKNLQVYQTEIKALPTYEARVKNMGEKGYAVPQEDAALHFASAVERVAQETGINFTLRSKITTRTNDVFFFEQSQTVNAQSKEQQLVNFLYRLGASNSLIRVRGLTLHTDPPRQQLVASITVAASYQRKTPLRQPTPPASRTSASIKDF
jgi:hypothetical protein